MNKLYLKNNNGQYYYGLPVYEQGMAVLLALELKDKVPSIMITNEKDFSIFEIENGQVVFPEDESFDDIPCMNFTENLFPSDINGLNYLINIRKQVHPRDEDFAPIEASLMAAAIHFDVNLRQFGWERP